MFEEHPRPRLSRFLLVDPLVFPAWVILLGGWLFYVLLARLGYIPLGMGRLTFTPSEVRGLLWSMAVLTVLLGPVAGLRIRGFRLAAASPVESRGHISRVDSRWWGRRIDFYYFVQGDKMHGRASSLRRRWVMELNVADQVTVVHNQYQPERVVIRGLYADESG